MLKTTTCAAAHSELTIFQHISEGILTTKAAIP